jgi:hypothetical protein
VVQTRAIQIGDAVFLQIVLARHRVLLAAAGITAYLKNGGTLEEDAAMAKNASARTTQLYDRRRDEVSLDEGGAYIHLKERYIRNKYDLGIPTTNLRRS